MQIFQETIVKRNLIRQKNQTSLQPITNKQINIPLQICLLSQIDYTFYVFNYIYELGSLNDSRHDSKIPQFPTYYAGKFKQTPIFSNSPPIHYLSESIWRSGSETISQLGSLLRVLNTGRAGGTSGSKDFLPSNPASETEVAIHRKLNDQSIHNISLWVIPYASLICRETSEVFQSWK